MVQKNWINLVVLLAMAFGSLGRVSPAVAQRLAENDPKPLAAEQKELLNYAYLTLRLDLHPSLKLTGDQVVAIRQERVGIIYCMTVQRDKSGEVKLEGGRGGGWGMVKLVLQNLTRVRDVLSDEQRQAFAKLLTDQKLKPVTVDASDSHFLLRYTFGPKDQIEKAKTQDGRILDVVVPEKEDFKNWYTELKTGDELIRALDNPLWEVRTPAGDWLIKRGAGELDASTKKRIAETILSRVEKGEAANPGWWMQVYGQVAQPDDENRALALLDKSDLHQLSGMVAAYAAIAPAKALDYIAKPRPDKQYAIRAIQGLGMAPDAIKLLQSARAKMPDMKWMIDQQVKVVTDLQKARAEGKPENPGDAAAIEARKKAQRDAENRAKSSKTPGDYQGLDDWFADLSSGDRRRMDKASDHFASSVYAVDLSKATAKQRSAVFEIAYAALTAPKTTINRDQAGKLLVASAGAADTDKLVALIKPTNGRSHFPLAALIKVNPDNAQQLILAIEYQRFSPFPVPAAARLVPAEAIPVLEKTQPKLKSDLTRETFEKTIAELKKAQGNP